MVMPVHLWFWVAAVTKPINSFTIDKVVGNSSGLLRNMPSKSGLMGPYFRPST